MSYLEKFAALNNFFAANNGFADLFDNFFRFEDFLRRAAALEILTAEYKPAVLGLARHAFEHSAFVGRRGEHLFDSEFDLLLAENILDI